METSTKENDGISRRKKYSIWAVAFLILCAFGFISWVQCEWIWFSRSGSLLVVFGLIFLYWDVLKGKKADDFSFWMTQKDLDTIKLFVGLTCVGTTVWGFGDWLGNIFQICR